MTNVVILYMFIISCSLPKTDCATQVVARDLISAKKTAMDFWKQSKFCKCPEDKVQGYKVASLEVFYSEKSCEDK